MKLPHLIIFVKLNCLKERRPGVEGAEERRRGEKGGEERRGRMETKREGEGGKGKGEEKREGRGRRENETPLYTRHRKSRIEHIKNGDTSMCHPFHMAFSSTVTKISQNSSLKSSKNFLK